MRLSMNNNNNSNAPYSASGLDQVNITLHQDPITKNSKKTSPLIISPRWDDSLAFICSWMEKNRSWMDAQILKHGAVLIRGFQIDTAIDFEKAVLAVQPDLCDAYRGTSPRSLKQGTKYAFSAADAPVKYPIAQHLEMSFLKCPPRHLYFGCLQAPTHPCGGGETSMCDFRAVYQDISPTLRDKLATKKLCYTRRHYKVGETFTYDVGAMLGWPAMFGTSDKQQVEQICQQEDAPAVQWVGPNQDTFQQQWIDEPFQYHPDTHEPVWFNHLQVFHWTTFPAELWHSFKRIKDIRLLMHFALVSIFTFIKYGLLGYKMALDMTFCDDGTPVSITEMNEIRAAIHKNMIYSRWQKGDIMCLDNFSMSHGRQPTYDKGRQVIVAWSHPFDKTSTKSVVVAQTTIPVDKKTNDKTPLIATSDKVAMVVFPDLMAVTPDSSPESTLTKEEANELQNSMLPDEKQIAKALASSHLVVEASSQNRPIHKRLASCPALLASDADFWKTPAE